MIFHVFNGSMTHFISIIEGIVSSAEKTTSNGLNSHTFYILIPNNFLFGDKGSELTKFEEVFNRYNFSQYLFIEDNNRSMKIILNCILSSEDRIILHGISISIRRYLYFIFQKRKVLEQIIKVEWGVHNVRKSNFKRRIRLLIENYFYSKYRVVVTLTSVEKEFILNRAPKAKVVVTNYISSTNLLYHKVSYNELLSKQKPLRIIVSHSGWEEMQHVTSFEQIKHLRYDDIQIVCPLCYGNADYINRTIEVGKELFGDKFFYFTKLKEKDEYAQLLSNSHIFITNAEIQTGLFAITVSVSNGIKVFLRDDNYKHMREIGCNVQETNDILKLTYSELIEPISEEMFNNNRLAIIQYYNQDKIANVWRSLYEVH